MPDLDAATAATPHLFPGHIEGICDFQTKAIPGIAFTQSGEAAQAEKGTKKREENLKLGREAHLSLFHVLLLRKKE